MNKWLINKRPREDDQNSEKKLEKLINVPKTKKRKYDELYLKLGFTWIGSLDEPNPQCVVCSEILSNKSMKPSSLKRHLESKHKNVANKEVQYFERLLEDLKNRKNNIKQFSGAEQNENALKASYKVNHLIAKYGKNHTIAENLILPAAVEIVSCMFGEKEAKIIKTIPLSNDTVSRRINDMAYDTKEQLVRRIRGSPCFGIQLDESADVAVLAQLIVFVRGIFQDEIFEDLLFCKTLKTSTKVCMDGAKAMSGHITGLVGHIKKVSAECKFTHCVLHREALAAKHLSEELKKVLDQSVKIVNSIKTRPQKSRYFKILCQDMGNLHENVLLYTEVRWLSRGNVLSRVFELREELHIFFTEHKSHFSSVINEFNWLLKLAYLSDIFEKLNIWNLSMQGSISDIFHSIFRLWRNNMTGYVTTFEKEQLIEVSCDPSMKNKFLNSGTTLLDFWICVGKEQKELSSIAVKFLVGFSTTYLCERGFLSLTYVKCKYRNKLNVEDDLRLYLTKLEPNIDKLCQQKQAHSSH
ncbi:hypothetical protein QTP88_010103 [Uroleucon formosanum]